MTHWAIVSEKEGNTPYVLAAIDRKSTVFNISPDGTMRKKGTMLDKKFAINPELNLVVLGAGPKDVTDPAAHEIMVQAQKGTPMRQCIDAGLAKLTTEMQRHEVIFSQVPGNLFTSAIAVAQVKGENELAYVDCTAAGKTNVDLLQYGFVYTNSSDYARDAYREYHGCDLPIAVALEVIIRSHERAVADHPDRVGRELDILLLLPNSKPMELQVGYEWGRPVVKRAKPITKTFVPWEAGNRSGFHMFNNAVAD